MTRNIFFVLVFAALMVFSAVVAVPVQAKITWPNWNEVATAYPDPTGDAHYPPEDMTICYVYNDCQDLYFRVEFADGIAPERIEPVLLEIYLDVDQNPATGFSIHDIGADWKLTYMKMPLTAVGVNTGPDFTIQPWTPIMKWDDDFHDWGHTPGLLKDMAGDNFVNLQVALSDLENEFWHFPIDLVFVSSSMLDLTDYNPNVGHITYPIKLPVGGDVSPVNGLVLLAPWIALAVTAIALGYTITRRKSQIRQRKIDA